MEDDVADDVLYPQLSGPAPTPMEDGDRDVPSFVCIVGRGPFHKKMLSAFCHLLSVIGFWKRTAQFFFDVESRPAPVLPARN